MSSLHKLMAQQTRERSSDKGHSVRQLYLFVRFTRAESANERHGAEPPEKRAPMIWANTALCVEQRIYYVISVVIITF